jgi:hypothetical protein
MQRVLTCVDATIRPERAQHLIPKRERRAIIRTGKLPLVEGDIYFRAREIIDRRRSNAPATVSSARSCGLAICMGDSPRLFL